MQTGSLLAGLVVWLGFGIGRAEYAVGHNLAHEPERVDRVLSSLADRVVPRDAGLRAVMAVVVAEVRRVIAS